MKSDSQDRIELVKMNVLLCPGKKPVLISQNYTGKKGRSRCRTAARHFHQVTGKVTEVYQTGGPSSRPHYYYTVAGSSIQQRGKLITRYGIIDRVTEQEKIYA